MLATIEKSEFWLTVIKILLILLLAYIVNVIIDYILNKLLNKSGKIDKKIVTNFHFIKKIKVTFIIIFAIIASLFQIPSLNSISWSILS